MKISRASVSRRIKAFEAVHEEYLFAGAGDPDDRDWKRRYYEKKREALIRYILDLAFEFGKSPPTVNPAISPNPKGRP